MKLIVKIMISLMIIGVVGLIAEVDMQIVSSWSGWDSDITGHSICIYEAHADLEDILFFMLQGFILLTGSIKIIIDALHRRMLRKAKLKEAKEKLLSKENK